MTHPRPPQGETQALLNRRVDLFLPAAGGSEALLAEEVQRLTGRPAQAGRGGVWAQGDGLQALRLNLESRIAQRVLWPLANGPYRDEHDLYDLARRVPWPDWITPAQTLRVDVNAQGSPLRSVNFAALRIKDAVCDVMREATGERPSVDTRHPDLPLVLYVGPDHATLFADTSGEALFKRGWRKHAVEAPLRENLAAGILRLAGWTPGTTLFDPMCGSGTFLVEAAQIAAGIPPGAGRGFAFQDLRAFQQELWESLRAPAPSPGSLASCGVIVGADSDPAAVAMARANCIEAGVAAQVQLLYGAFVEIDPPVPPGLLVTNPPYGVRVGDREALAAAYPAWGDRLKQRYAGWRACFLSADMDLARHIGLKAQRRVPLYNGALACRLFEYFMVAGRPGASGAP